MVIAKKYCDGPVRHYLDLALGVKSFFTRDPVTESHRGYFTTGLRWRLWPYKWGVNFR